MVHSAASLTAPRRPRGSPFLYLVAVLASTAIQAQTVVDGPAGAVSADDVRAAMQRVPTASRDAMLSRPEVLRRQADDIYLRRALAGEAEHDGLDKDPLVAAALRQARERVLSDARLAAIDAAAVPPAADLTRYARNLYDDNPERYRTPEQTRASHILVARRADGKAREQAEAMLAQIKAGASFEALAREQSADGATASKGGDLGWFAAGQMVPEFERALAQLKNPGDLSDVVETQFGFHLVRLDGRRAAGLRTFDEARPDIERDMVLRAQREARNLKVRELREKAKADTAALEAMAQQPQKP
jgi:peptidyl-prolyl cis-trans isomerase C